MKTDHAPPTSFRLFSQRRSVDHRHDEQSQSDPPDGSHRLDPSDWPRFRQLGHQMLDDMFDLLQAPGTRPVWQPTPPNVRETFREPLPQKDNAPDSVYALFKENILPHTVDTGHPGFMGWAAGAGTPAGMLAEMLAAGLNANAGVSNHAPVMVERQIVSWVRELFGFPATASGLLVTGSSMANLIGVLIARRRMLDDKTHAVSVASDGGRLIAYASSAAHSCIARGMNIAGLSASHLRAIPTGADGAMNLDALQACITDDRAAGRRPFMIVGTAGTIDTGAFDDLKGIHAIAQREGLHFHVDGAFGAFAILAPVLRSRLNGIELADSIAMDFHKWLHVPYDAGFILVRDGDLHLDTFRTEEQTYLARLERGIASDPPWPCDLGPDLSRGFRALKVWFTLKVHGTRRLGTAITRNCDLARYMAQCVLAEPRLELVCATGLNIVCYRFRCREDIADALNREVLLRLQESGLCAPSSTYIGGRFTLRAALFNHRSGAADVDMLLAETLRHGLALINQQLPTTGSSIKKPA